MGGWVGVGFTCGSIDLDVLVVPGREMDHVEGGGGGGGRGPEVGVLPPVPPLVLCMERWVGGWVGE